MIERVLSKPEGLPAALDEDCDGVVTDAEVFEAAKTNLSPRSDQNPPRPKFRPAWAPIPLFVPKTPRAGCSNPKVTLANLGSLAPKLETLLGKEASYRAGKGLGDELPSVVWLTDRSISLDDALYVVPAASVDARALARGFLSTRVWRASSVGGRAMVTPINRPGVVRRVEEEIPAPGPRLGREEEISLLLSPFEGDLADNHRRYMRPVTASEHDDLTRHGFVACGCTEPIGHCFCRTRADRAGGKP
jgi:hypothetical protein